MNKITWKIESLQDGIWKTNQSSNKEDIFLVNEFDNRENDLVELKGYKRQQISVKTFDTEYNSREEAQAHIDEFSKLKAVCPMRIKDAVRVHEGLGKVIGEFVVGMVIETDKIEYWKDSQKYAHEITNLIIYDEPLDIKEFVGWNKVNKIVEKYNSDYEMNNSLESLMKNRKGYWETYHISKCYLTNPPQGRAYVVEK